MLRETLARSFFARDPLTCARELIGCELVWNECAGIVVETEAYAARGDEACHTFMRKSAREFIAGHSAGAAYVYMNYGVHWLLNVLVKGSEKEEEQGFVLIRALEPTCGIESMEQRRFSKILKTRNQPADSLRRALCSGPGKLTQALAIHGSDHGRDLCGVADIGVRPRQKPVRLVADVRIGISKAAHLPWRFLLKDSLFVSVPLRGGKTMRRIKPIVKRKQ